MGLSAHRRFFERVDEVLKGPEYFRLSDRVWSFAARSAARSDSFLPIVEASYYKGYYNVAWSIYNPRFAGALGARIISIDAAAFEGYLVIDHPCVTRWRLDRGGLVRVGLDERRVTDLSEVEICVRKLRPTAMEVKSFADLRGLIKRLESEHMGRRLPTLQGDPLEILDHLEPR